MAMQRVISAVMCEDNKVLSIEAPVSLSHTDRTTSKEWLAIAFMPLLLSSSTGHTPDTSTVQSPQ